ncbi:hypothetical protein HDV06_004456 [Boothiomyces sp. JEL0866]|nr:hypothetical protein HDV06_004456 [Boothiomyces sp. JEL0866]
MNGMPYLNGINGSEHNVLADGTKVYVREAATNTEVNDPSHTVYDITIQIYGLINNVKGKTPDMSGFGSDAALGVGQNLTLNQSLSTTFGYHTKKTLPVITTLAQEYAIVDDWFSSVPGPTYPNRHFLHCATALGRTDNDHDPDTGLPCKTVFDQLNEQKITWKAYNANKQGSTLYRYQSMQTQSNSAKIVPFQQFISDAKSGLLSQYTFIEPDLGSADYHPPSNTNGGEDFLKNVYNAVRSSPQWQNTLLFVTFDEHGKYCTNFGGFYDHVPPPTNVPIPDNSAVVPGSGDFAFERLGVRVPTIIISPWVSKGQVFRSSFSNRNFEHSSVSATLKKFFGFTNFLTKRDAWAVSFHSAVNYLQSPRTDCLSSI